MAEKLDYKKKRTKLDAISPNNLYLTLDRCSKKTWGERVMPKELNIHRKQFKGEPRETKQGILSHGA